MALNASRGVPSSIIFEGKDVNLWTWGQLEKLNKEKLKVRAMDLRDAVGADRVSRPPHYEEGLRFWILQTQCCMAGCEMEDFGLARRNSQGMPVSRVASEATVGETGWDEVGPAGGGYRDARMASQMNRGSQNLLGGGAEADDRQAAYAEADAGRRMARIRNQGQGNPLAWN